MAFPATPGLPGRLLFLLVLVGALCCAVRAAAPPASCPPLQSQTVQVDCRRGHGGPAVDCATLPAAPGTVATFRCKPLHQPLFGFQPAAGYESRCGASGQWSARPFRCVPICGRPTGRPTALVRDGEEVGSAADYPWHVTIYDVTLDMKQICGGSLVTPKFFVSAAHCFHDNTRALPPTRYMSGFAKTKRSATSQEPQEQFRPLEKIYMKDYGARKLHYVNDIALVELENEVAVTAWTLPVCVDWGLELPDLRHGEQGTVVGFGNTALEASETLRFAKLPFVRSDECKKLVHDQLAIFNLLPDKYCVGFYNNTSVAPGDSGGGMAFPNEDRAWYLRGVVSVGSSKVTTYSYFTNVTAFVPWISGIIRQGELKGSRCGVDLAESSVVDGAVADRQDFPWELDVYLKQTAGRPFERLWSGVLVQPNLVITSVVRDPTDQDPRVDLTEFPASYFRVASRRNAESALRLEGSSGNVSEVLRIFSTEDVFSQFGTFYSFVLLELKQPLNLMPVCVDWLGTAQLASTVTGTTFFETPSTNSRAWKRYPALNATKCTDLSASLPSHYVCAYHQGAEPRYRSRSLLVSVDGSWYLRGMWYASLPYNDGSMAVFTDMGDAGVLRWLDTAKDKLGKPTCGNINLCEPLSPLQPLPGHMPWSVAVADKRGRVAGSGLLVHPYAVLTASAVLKAATGWNGTTPFAALGAAELTVLFTEQDGTSRTASVARVNVYETVAEEAEGYSRSVVLLELAASDAIYSTPLCLDLSGNVLQPLFPGQVGLVEAWPEWRAANHSLVGASFLGTAECTKRAPSLVGERPFNTAFCLEGQRGTAGPQARGGGYMVYTGTQWYLQGLHMQNAALRRADIMIAADLRDKALRAWLRKKMDKLAAVDADRLLDKATRDCEGGRPVVSQCGEYVSADQSAQTADVDVLTRETRDHMPWNLQVHVDYGGADGWNVRAGVLVKANLVLTSARRLVTKAGRPIPISDLFIKYVSVDQRDRRIVEVEGLHVRTRAAARPQDFAYDLALLVLKAPVDITPVCLPTAALPRVGAGTAGLVEVDMNTHVNPLVPVHYRTADQCKGLAADADAMHVAADEFCGQTTVRNLASGSGERNSITPLGYALSVKTDGVWYLRGVLDSSWGDNAYAFANLDGPEVVAWIAAKAGNATGTGQQPTGSATTTTPTSTTAATAAPTAARKPPTTSRPPTTARPPTTSRPATPGSSQTTPSSFKCGQTSLPLASLAANGTLAGHLPWTVGVVLTKDDGSIGISVGVLVRENVVITEGVTLVVPRNRWNSTGDVRGVDVSRLRVEWVGPTGRRKRVEVAALHVHERDRGPRWDKPWDVALLVLKVPIRKTELACIDLAADESALPPIATGDVGVVETWRGDFYEDRRLLVALPALTFQHCRARLAGHMEVAGDEDSVTDDRFCGERPAEPVWSGGPFLVRWRGAWFLRGVLSFTMDKTGLGVFADLNDESVRDWLRDKIHTPDISYN